MIITIDGPSGTGKSTIAPEVAKRLNFVDVDTGAMYRAVTLLLLEQGISLEEEERIAQLLGTFSFDIRVHDGAKYYFIDGRDVSTEIRSQRINEAVSKVAEKRVVREALWKIQRDFAARQGAVFEGRDMGSVVFPQADLKVYLDASPRVRAKRRLRELLEKLPEEAKGVDLDQMEAQLLKRDAIDSARALAPLIKPKGALVIDTSDLSIQEIVDKIVCKFQKKARSLIPSWRHAKGMHFVYRFVIFSAYYFFKLFYGHKVYGLEHYCKRAAIIAPNHTSYFDPPIAAASWPGELHFLAKESLFRPFLFGRLIRSLNSHPVRGDVGDVAVFKVLLDLLKGGNQVIVFPEGGRTEGEIGKIKPGIGILLMRSKGAIVPTYIHGAFETWPRNRKLPRFRGKTACVFGSPIVWESFSHLEKREAQEAIAKTLSTEIKELKEWYEKGAKGVPP